MIARTVVADRIKLLAAALVFIIGMGAFAALVVPLIVGRPALGVAIMLVATFLLLGAIAALFNTRVRARPRVTISELEAQGLWVDQTFRARRAFQVEEFEDEGASYFIELLDGSVLFLNGQYLWSYGAGAGADKVPQPRRFPCSQFVVRRHVSEHWVAEIACAGTVLEPECISPPLFSGVLKEGDIPADGDIIQGKTYDALKLELTAASRL